MEVVDDVASCPRPPQGTVVSIGAYDGVHLGHQRLISQLRDLAAQRGCASAVVTFDRHPALVVRPASAPRQLTDLDTKLELLAATGLDYAVVLRFDEARSREPAEDFVRTVLVDCLASRSVVVGHDFHFGHHREGNVAFLQRLGPSLGFDVQGVDLFDDESGGGPVSSTRVRSALAAGDVATATFLLGRPHRVRGVVVATGETVEVAVAAELCLPAEGTYAGWYDQPDGARHRATVTVPATTATVPATTATVAGGAMVPGGALDGEAGAAGLFGPPSVLEVHLPDFDGPQVGESPVIEFFARLHDQPGPDDVEARVV